MAVRYGMRYKKSKENFMEIMKIIQSNNKKHTIIIIDVISFFYFNVQKFVYNHIDIAYVLAYTLREFF